MKDAKFYREKIFGKEEKPKRKKTDENGEITVASSNECTGLVTGMPIDEHEAESYKEIYDIHLTE